MDKYLLKLRMAQMSEKLTSDIQAELGTAEDQYQRLADLIEACAPTNSGRELRKDFSVWVNYTEKSNG